MRTVYLEPVKTRARVLGIRALLARLPAFAMVGIFVYWFMLDPLFPYHIMMHPWVHAMALFMVNGQFRDQWLMDYGIITVLIVAVLLFFVYAMKAGLWNHAFKILKIRTRIADDIIETELGRAYWIEDYTSRKWRAALVGLLKGLHIADVRVEAPAPTTIKKRYRVLSKTMPASLRVYKETSSPKVVKASLPPDGMTKKTLASRSIFYLPYFKMINPFSPHRSMHRLVITVPDEAIEIHDGDTVLVEGVNLLRDLRQPYPTFILTGEQFDKIDLKISEYRDDFNMMVQKATFTTNLASQMDTMLMKEQRKYQEVSVPVNPEMVRQLREREKP